MPRWSDLTADQKSRLKGVVDVEDVPKTNKYRVAPKKDRTYRGKVYDSKGEMEYAIYLRGMLLSKRIRSFREQVPFNLVVGKHFNHRYTIDFEVVHLDGRVELVEFKGFQTDDWKLRHDLFRSLYPDRWYTLVQKERNTTSRRRRTRAPRK